jgi:hypothetical protein
MANRAVEKFLVTSGNHAVFPAGLPVYTCVNGNCAGGNVIYNAAAEVGQPVFYDSKTRLSVDPSATPNVGPLVFGVFSSSKRNGVVDGVKKVANEKLTCDFDNARGLAPICGIGEVHKTLVDCIKCGGNYTTRITLDNNRSRNEFNEFGRKAEYVFTVPTTCCSCTGDCDPQFDCRQYLCNLVDLINGDGGHGTCLINGKLESKNFGIKPYAEAYVLNPTTYTFCLDASSGACSSCDLFTGLNGISIGGVVTTFPNTSGATNSTEDQLDLLIKNINCTFPAHQGYAYRVRGGNIQGTGCCPVAISINTCLTVDGLSQTAGGLLAPCDTVAETFTSPGATTCLACGALPNPALTYPCGWGLVTHNAKDGCACCDGPQNPVRYFGSHATITNEGFDCNSTFTTKVQSAELPVNTGVQLWYEDYYTETGGSGREYHDGEIVRGRFPRSIDISRSKGTDIDCATNYCVIALDYTDAGSRPKPLGSFGGVKFRTRLGVPHGDIVTKASVLEDINALITAGRCALAPINCDSIVCP